MAHNMARLEAIVAELPEAQRVDIAEWGDHPTFRVRGKGATKKDGTKGALLATVEVQVPAHLSPQAREAVEAYRAATGGDSALRTNLFEAQS